MVALPAWSENMVPVDMDGAAVLLGISRRYLVDVLRKHPYYEPRGVKKVFYPEHITRLRDALCAQNLTEAKALSSGQSMASGMSPEPLPETAYEKALALATKSKPKSSRPTTKASYGNVISLAKKP